MSFATRALYVMVLFHGHLVTAEHSANSQNSNFTTPTPAFSPSVNNPHVVKPEGGLDVVKEENDVDERQTEKHPIDCDSKVKDRLKRLYRAPVYPRKTPAILFWTNWLQIDEKPVEKQCGKWTCYITSDRKLLSHPQTRGIFFYGSDMVGEDLPLPRLPHHEWGLLHEESPMNNFMLVHGPMIRLFNHTATFRRESHFPLSTQNIESVGYLLKRKPVPVAEKNKLKKLKGFASVLYVQSHCNIASDRERYVKELMEYIPVDSYGGCINNKKLPEHMQDPVKSMESASFLDFIAQYKFHIAFENAICDDYMTEKLFRVLHVGAVPIYHGSPRARDWMPNGHSIIMANDFQSPKELALFIQRIDADDVKYEQYLKYKNDGIENDFLLEHLETRGWGPSSSPAAYGDDFIQGFQCYLCEQLSIRYYAEERAKSDSSMKVPLPRLAERDHLNCPQPYPSVNDVDDLPRDDSWKAMSWIEDYWNGYDRARAAARMVDRREKDPSKFDIYWMEILKESGQL